MTKRKKICLIASVAFLAVYAITIPHEKETTSVVPVETVIVNDENATNKMEDFMAELQGLKEIKVQLTKYYASLPTATPTPTVEPTKEPVVTVKATTTPTQKPTVKPTEKPKTVVKTTESEPIDYEEEDLALLVALIHCEARYEPYEGKVALANIALNRVKNPRLPNTVYEVLHQKNQFTVVRKQIFKDTVKNYNINPNENMQETIKAATAALNGYNNIEDRVFYNGARWETHRSHKNPLQIGAHLFWSL